MSTLNPIFAKAVDERPIDITEASNPIIIREQRRKHLERLRHLYLIPGPIPNKIIEEAHFVPAEDGYQIPVRVYTPVQRPTEGSPVIILIHEGGFMMGDLTDEEMNCRLFTRELGAVCLNIEYRLGPEHPFPTGITDCWTVVQWAAANYETILDANPAKGFVVGGSSAGGNISSVLAQLAVTRQLSPPLTGQWLSVPFCIPPGLLPVKYEAMHASREGNIEDPVIGKMGDDGVRGLMQAVNITDPNSDLFSPFSSKYYPPSNRVAGQVSLAKAFFQCAGLDPLRDDSFIYSKALQEEWGVQTRLKCYDGYSHMFWTNWPELEKSKEYWMDMLEGMKWLVSNE